MSLHAPSRIHYNIHQGFTAYMGKVRTERKGQYPSQLRAPKPTGGNMMQVAGRHNERVSCSKTVVLDDSYSGKVIRFLT